MLQEVRIPQYVQVTFFEESAVLLDSRNNVFYNLNDSAAIFWKLLTIHNSFQKTIEVFLDSYEYQSSNIISEDLKELIDSLTRIGLLVRI
jgi:hypothetical protein